MAFKTTQENWLSELRKRVNLDKGKKPTSLLDAQFSDCQDCWGSVIRQEPEYVVQFLMKYIVTKPFQPMTNSQYRRLKELLIAVCERAAFLRERGGVMRGFDELMQALATHMPELNRDLREHEESLQRESLDPIA
ncbi:hypothetical protein IT415_03145 [bacterium]|nr:hypothetical protein [bacterium]